MVEEGLFNDGLCAWHKQILDINKVSATKLGNEDLFAVAEILLKVLDYV